MGSGTTAPAAPCSQNGPRQGLRECGDAQPGPEAPQRPSLTVGTDGPVLVLPDQHHVHEVSGRNEPHGRRGGSGSGHTQGLSGPGVVHIHGVIISRNYSQIPIQILKNIMSLTVTGNVITENLVSINIHIYDAE